MASTTYRKAKTASLARTLYHAAGWVFCACFLINTADFYGLRDYCAHLRHRMTYRLPCET